MVKGLVTDFKHLPSRENLFWVGVGGAGALAVHPVDDTLNAHLSGNDALWAPGRIIGSTPVLLGTAVTRLGQKRLRIESLIGLACHVGFGFHAETPILGH